ncbi:MAG: group II intron reverse transcriptase/maturase [Gemmatimonadaceae bacterium]|nr:group II intron reverse transcriptase/maturase [Gemmatimonadaceae bacterium]
MLEALERGVKGGKWHSLIDKVTRETSLGVAWKQVEARKGGGGVDGMSIAIFSKRSDKRIARLSEQLREGTYEPHAVKRVWIPKADGKKRPLGVPTIIDRVVQTSIRNAIEPIFEKKFLECSYGFRPGRGCKDALREVSAGLKQGRTWVVDVDIEKYFDSIDKKRLMDEVAEELADGSLLALINQFLEQDVMDGMKRWQPEKGTPQGAVISPLLANIYLHPVDVAMTREGYRMIRYADDMVILCTSKEEAERAHARLDALLTERMLTLHPVKTRIVDATQRPGFDFLGYRFFGRFRYPRPTSEKKLRDAVREKTPRTNGQSLKAIIASVNLTLRGWYEYFKHSSRYAFNAIDQWVRMRLRSILRKRSKRKGRGQGLDHFRWPNAFFQQHGLFSLVQAHVQLIQSLRSAH